MTKLIAMTTAAALALTSAAAAQDMNAETAPQEDAVAEEAATPAPSVAAETETIMHTADKAGIVSMDGGEVDTTAPAEPELAVIDETIAEDDAMMKAREMFAAADTDGDDVLSANEFINALRPVADAIEQDAAPVIAEVEVEAPTVTDDAADEAEAEQATVAEADADGEPMTETRELSPSDYLTAKFETISGVDGQLSLEELETAHSADFEAADADGDDVLDADEAEAFAALTTGRASYR